MTPHDINKMTLEEVDAILSPVAKYTEIEHLRAWVRYASNTVYNRIFDIQYDIKRGKLTSLDEINDLLIDVLNPQDMPVGEMEDDPLHRGDSYDGWLMHAPEAGASALGNHRKWFEEIAERGQHGGDCTSMPFTCMRCMVDEFYGARTIGWKPGNGYLLVQRVKRLEKQTKIDNTL